MKSEKQIEVIHTVTIQDPAKNPTIAFEGNTGYLLADLDEHWSRKCIKLVSAKPMMEILCCGKSCFYHSSNLD